MGPTPHVTSASRPRPRRRPHRRPRRPTTPHDALFKGIFSHPDEARGLLRTVLPPAILSQLDLRTLTIHTGSFVDRALAARHTDLLFSARLGGCRVFLYVLFEQRPAVHRCACGSSGAAQSRRWTRCSNNPDHVLHPATLRPTLPLHLSISATLPHSFACHPLRSPLIIASHSSKPATTTELEPEAWSLVMSASIDPGIDGSTWGVVSSAPMSPSRRVIHRHRIVPDPVGWVLTEETVPESKPHLNVSARIDSLFHRWAILSGRRVLIGRNQALRWDREHPQYGLDPDVYIVEPPPPEGEELRSLKLWQPGHVAPMLAVEVVSAGHPFKDYVDAPRKYAACGVGELWILDRDLEGPRACGGPYRIQVWRWVDRNQFAQVYAGEGPAWSEALQAWIQYLPEERTFSLSSDEEGRLPWLTTEEAERAAREAAQREVESEREVRERAERRIAELEALLAGRTP